MEKNKFKKISAVVPDEFDFCRAIRHEYQLLDRYCDMDIRDIRIDYAFKVMSAGTRLADTFTDVLNQFPDAYRLDQLYATLLNQRYNMNHYAQAVSEVSYAQELVEAISGDFVQLLLKDDCDSRDKCKSLRVTALARMFTFAKRCIPALGFLAKVREFMANVENDAAATALINEYADVFPLEKDIFPKPLSEDEIADFVDLETLLWLEELDRQYELWLKSDDGQGAKPPRMEASDSVGDDDQEEDCVKVQQM